MGKAKKRKAFKRRATERDDVTDERRQHNHFASVGMARRVIPVIDTLVSHGIITEREYRALAHYRDQASLADRSPVKSCIDDSPSAGDRPGVAITSAIIETAKIERDLGELRSIARAVAVDDKSLTQWCIDKHGGRERINARGETVAIVPIGEKRHVAMARMELRMAARRIKGIDF